MRSRDGQHRTLHAHTLYTVRYTLRGALVCCCTCVWTRSYINGDCAFSLPLCARFIVSGLGGSPPPPPSPRTRDPPPTRRTGSACATRSPVGPSHLFKKFNDQQPAARVRMAKLSFIIIIIIISIVTCKLLI